MAWRQQPGQADSPKREPERIQPVTEEYAGVNFPYRGTEQHGVTVPENAKYDTREFQYPEESPDEYMEPEPEPDPIPVRVVNSSARERLEWRAARIRVTDQATTLVGRHDKRRRLRIKCHYQTDGVDSNPVWIGSDNGVKPFTGYQIDRGETIDPFTTTEPIWGICNPGESVEVSVMYEFAVEL